MPKIVTGTVDMRSLLIVVVRDSSAKNSQIGSDASGDSKKVKSAQLIQLAFAHIVT